MRKEILIGIYLFSFSSFPLCAAKYNDYVYLDIYGFDPKDEHTIAINGQAKQPTSAFGHYETVVVASDKLTLKFSYCYADQKEGCIFEKSLATNYGGKDISLYKVQITRGATSCQLTLQACHASHDCSVYPVASRRFSVTSKSAPLNNRARRK